VKREEGRGKTKNQKLTKIKKEIGFNFLMVFIFKIFSFHLSRFTFHLDKG